MARPKKSAAPQADAKKGAATPLSSIKPTVQPQPPAPKPEKAEVQAVELSTYERENPDRLTGEPLRELAHKLGMARSSINEMPEDKLRREMHLIVHRRNDELEVA